MRISVPLRSGLALLSVPLVLLLGIWAARGGPLSGTLETLGAAGDPPNRYGG